MHRLAIVFVVMLMGLSILVAPNEVDAKAKRKKTPPPPPAATVPADQLALDAEEQAFLRLLNQYRQSRGLVALTVNQQLTAAAVWHSTDMATKNYFSHTDSLGRDPFKRMAAFGYTANTWKGENIAAGYATATAVFEGWKASAGHNANMLNPNYRVIGIGRVVKAGSRYTTYWTTDFGGQ